MVDHDTTHRKNEYGALRAENVLRNVQFAVLYAHLNSLFNPGPALVRMRSPVQIWIAAPLKPVVPQGIAGFCFAHA